MVNKLTRITAIILSFWPVFAASEVVVIDSGHSLERTGASGIHYSEWKYNDLLVLELDRKLSEHQVILTRAYGKELQPIEIKPSYLDLIVSNSKWSQPYVRDLYSRSDLANQKNADIFISIHHDSVQSEYLVEGYSKLGAVNRDTNLTFKQRFSAGFSIFVSSRNPQFSESVEFATLLGRELNEIGRTPSNFHTEKRSDKKENYTLIDARYGIYDSRFAVLKSTLMPAVIVEVGVITDKGDEQEINSNEFRKRFSWALSRALNNFFESKNQAAPISPLY